MIKQKRSVLIDASSCILLFKIGLINELINYYNIVLAQSVYDELTKPGYSGSEQFKNYKNDNNIIVKDINLNNKTEYKPLLKLDKGERDTIILYFNNSGEFIIIDDGRGAAYCRDNNIPYINALLVIKILYFSNSISESTYNDKMNELISIGRYSKNIINFADTCTKDRLEFFFSLI